MDSVRRGTLINLVTRLAGVGLVLAITTLTARIGTCHWPAFNVADSSIFIGAALLIWDSVRKKPAAAGLSAQRS